MHFASYVDLIKSYGTRSLRVLAKNSEVDFCLDDNVAVWYEHHTYIDAWKNKVPRYVILTANTKSLISLPEQGFFELHNHFCGLKVAAAYVDPFKTVYTIKRLADGPKGKYDCRFNVTSNPNGFVQANGLVRAAALPVVAAAAKPVCECGAGAVGIAPRSVGHSSWCPVAA